MTQLQEISLELGCVCEVPDEDGLSVCCRFPAGYYDPEADESGPIYFCESHRPPEDVYITFIYG
jgi:hypothetical protein